MNRNSKEGPISLSVSKKPSWLPAETVHSIQQCYILKRALLEKSRKEKYIELLPEF